VKQAPPEDDVRPSQHPRLGWGLFAAVIALVVGRGMTVTAATPPRRLSIEERREVGLAAATEEPMWRKTSVKNFPDDHWSQDDDFSASERHWTIDQTNRRGVPAVDIYQAIDEDLHARPPQPPRKSGASPCKPRPSYD
jgi:hypothetical protein